MSTKKSETNLLKESGLRKSKVRNRESALVRFLNFAVFQGIKSISEIDNELLNAFAKTYAGYSKSYFFNQFHVLKCFFEYAAENGYSIPNIQWPKICIYKDKNIPQYYTAEEIKAILGAVDRANPLGKRDYAILMLAAHCGFRAGDIKKLEFSDIDFENCQINITQEKTEKPLCTYLLPDVGWAIIDYLQNGRPQSDCPQIFITHRTPYESFVQSAALSHVIKKYSAAANVRGKKEQKNSFHMLRYSLASDLLRQDIPLTTISGILGHSELNITSTYTRLDFNQLKACALEVPV